MAHAQAAERQVTAYLGFAIFFFNVISLRLFNVFRLDRLRVVHTAGAVFFTFSLLRRIIHKLGEK